MFLEGSLRMSDYNYPNFPLDMTAEDFRQFREVLNIGDKAPGCQLINVADGSSTSLSDYWSKGPVMIEFGSIT